MMFYVIFCLFMIKCTLLLIRDCYHLDQVIRSITRKRCPSCSWSFQLSLGMGQDDCLTSLPSTIHAIRLSWIVGCILSAIGYGALLVVGYACYLGLRRRDSQSGGHSRVNNNKALIVYVIFTLVLTTATEVVDIIATLNGVLDDVCFFQNMLPRNPYVGPFTIPLWLINVTTDGLFVRISN